MNRLAILLGLALFVGCARFKTTDQLRAEQRRVGATGGDPDALQPCEVPSFDDFGWRADSLGPLRLRVPSQVRSIPTPAYGRKEFAYKTGGMTLDLASDAGEIYRSQLFRGVLVQAPRWAEVVCEIAGRPADVAVPIQKGLFSTAIRWSEAVGNETLVGVVTARTIEDYRVLRALMFTIRFPDGR